MAWQQQLIFVFRALCPFVFSLMVFSPASAELYKWQDEYGKWHFSDERPQDVDPDVKVEKDAKFDGAKAESQQVLSSDQSTDYQSVLLAKFPDTTPIAQVTLGVVTVEAPLGAGSGFFISNQGHIVTNKHVVRPNQSTAFEESQSKFDEAKKQFDKLKRELDDERQSLEKFNRQLTERRAELEDRGFTSNRALAEEEFKAYEDRYQRRKQDYDKSRRIFEQKKREFDEMNSEFAIKSSLSSVAKHFKIIFKDNTTIKAQLLAISQDHDLALLKIAQAKTPKLEVFHGQSSAQGTSVFAIGSPMGIRDSVTKGIITGYREGFIVTDTQILPGNSGGPLVLEDGQVIGVNTFKLAQEANRQGFGLAIPIAVVKKEFSEYLPQEAHPTQ